MKTKNFDCVEMKRSVAKHIFEQTKRMSREEELAFWKEKEDELRRLCRPGSPPRHLPKSA
jgi:hypothetical protein